MPIPIPTKEQILGHENLRKQSSEIWKEAQIDAEKRKEEKLKNKKVKGKK